MKQYKTPFYKTDFYITGAEERQRHTDPIQYKFTKVSGWGLTLEAPSGDIIEIGLDRRPKQWKITERTTGLLLTLDTYSTREQARVAISPELLQKVADELKKPQTLRLINELADYIVQEGATER